MTDFFKLWGDLVRVLVGCECSSTVTKAFRNKGIEAFSCDIQDCYGDLPEYHIKGDLREVFYSVKPDLLIAHPPCTYLAKSSAVRLYGSDHQIKDMRRYEQGILARDFFLWCLSRRCLVAVENPNPLRVYELPKWDQIIEPYYFGEYYSKRTFLWLRGLPPLKFTKIVRPRAQWVMSTRNQDKRSKTFDGIASAMADCWSGDLDGLQLDGGWL